MPSQRRTATFDENLHKPSMRAHLVVVFAEHSNIHYLMHTQAEEPDTNPEDNTVSSESCSLIICSAVAEVLQRSRLSTQSIAGAMSHAMHVDCVLWPAQWFENRIHVDGIH